MNLTVNGKPLAVADSISGAQLLSSLGIPLETAVAEVNGEHIPRSVFHSMELREGDSVELVSLVGGG